MHLGARLCQTFPKAGKVGQGRGDGEPEEAGAAHAEFRRAPVDPADQAFRQIDIHPLRRIRRIDADDEISEKVAAPGKGDPCDRRRLGQAGPVLELGAVPGDGDGGLGQAPQALLVEPVRRRDPDPLPDREELAQAVLLGSADMKSLLDDTVGGEDPAAEEPA